MGGAADCDDRGCRNDLCTGTALTRDLVLTAAHCVTRPVDYTIKPYQTGVPIAVRTIVRHPESTTRAMPPAAPPPISHCSSWRRPARHHCPGNAGSAAPRRRRRDPRRCRNRHHIGGDRARAWPAPHGNADRTGKPGSLQIRLYDTATRNQRIGLGGCTGKSGAPAFDGDGPLVIGVVSWSTAPGDEEGCGGLTGVTPLLLYRDWILETARKLNSPLAP